MECAIGVIAEEGFGSASLARIAERAGVAKSVVLYHFASKAELVEKVLSAVALASAEVLGARVATATTARERIRAVLEASVEFSATHRTYALAGLETWNQMRSLPGRTSLTGDPDATGTAAIERILADGQRGGEFGEFDPHVMALMFRQAIDATVLEVALNPDTDFTHFAAELVALFDRATRPGDPNRGNEWSTPDTS